MIWSLKQSIRKYETTSIGQKYDNQIRNYDWAVRYVLILFLLTFEQNRSVARTRKKIPPHAWNEVISLRWNLSRFTYVPFMREDIKHFAALMIVSANKMNAFNVLAIKVVVFSLIAFECFIEQFEVYACVCVCYSYVCARACVNFFLLLRHSQWSKQ